MSTPSFNSALQTMSPPVSFLPMSLLVSISAPCDAPIRCIPDIRFNG